MSFLYPRTISIRRQNQNSNVGAIGYGGALQTTETVIASNIKASIQLKRDGRTAPTNLPMDGRLTLWAIFFRADNGLVIDRDVIVDDLGVRYQVLGAYWNSLGYNCLCERLEA